MCSDQNWAVQLNGVVKKFTRAAQSIDVLGEVDGDDEREWEQPSSGEHADTIGARRPRWRRRIPEALPEPVYGLSAVTLTVPRGQGLALLGPTGGGKTTLLRLVSGVYSPDEGRVLVRGRVGGGIAAGAGRSPDLTLRENAFLQARLMGVRHDQALDVVGTALSLAGVRAVADKEYRAFSDRVWRRLELAVAVSCVPEVYLADGDLVVGDRAFQDLIMDEMRRLRDAGHTFVIATGQRRRLRQLCDRAVVLLGGGVVFDGSLDDGLAALDSLTDSDQ